MAGAGPPVRPLAGGFAVASDAAWRRLVEQALKGGGLDELVHRTPDGLEIAPLYGPAEITPLARAAAEGERAWDIREIIAPPRPDEANRRILEALNSGATSTLVVIGADGVDVRGPGDLARTLEGVALELAGVALDAGFLGAAAADWLAEAAKASPRARLSFHLDPLTAFAQQGRSPGPLAGQVARAAETAARRLETYPHAGLFLASGRAVHEAGGTDAQELGLMAAAALCYAKGLVAAGVSMQAAFAGLVLGVSLDAAPLTGIAKLRAARLVWDQLTAACGVSSPARIEARSSRRMLSRRDPWTNLLRLSCAAFAGAVGGADALVVEPFTAAGGVGDERARRLARNTQLILMDEAGLGRVQDPAAGSGFLEAHSLDLARAAWDQFRAIEANGGAAEALRSGRIAERVATARTAAQAAVASGASPLVGVTLHPGETAPAEPGPPGPYSAPAEAALAGPDDTCPPLSPIRWSEPFETAA